MTAFGARGATTVLHKLTVSAFVVFILTTLSIALLSGSRSASSVLGDEPAPVTAPAPAGTGEGDGEPVPVPAAPEAAAPQAEEPPSGQ